MTGARNYWRVRLGAKGKYARECLEGEFVGTDFVGVDVTGDLKKSKNEFSEKYKKIYKKENPKLKFGKGVGSKISIFYKFCIEMSVGDRVLCPDQNGTYIIGELVGNNSGNGYYFDVSSELMQKRKVNWKWGIFSRDEIDESLLKVLDTPPTVVGIRSNLIPKIEELIEKGSKVNSRKSVFGLPVLSFSEYSIEECLVQCWESVDVFKGFQFDSRQVVVNPAKGGKSGDRADMVFLNKQENKFLVVEIKKSNVGKDALDQLRRYMNALAHEKNEEYSGMKKYGCLVGRDLSDEVNKEIKDSGNIFFLKYSVEGYSRNSKGYENGMIVSVGFKKG